MTTRPRTRVAVMQPYFFPYAGYFRLFAHADTFVIYDCVQFPRRGRVHRTEVPGLGGGTEWLTLPLAHQPRSVLIQDLEFAAAAREELDRRLARLEWFGSADHAEAHEIRELLRGPLPPVVDFLEATLRLTARLLGVERAVTRSSGMKIDPDLRGQARVLAILKRTGATEYLNAPGGRQLYEPAAFDEEDIRLEFLPDYRGRYCHLLHALMTEPIERVRQDLHSSGEGESATRDT
jgi:hypothetical protein